MIFSGHFWDNSMTTFVLTPFQKFCAYRYSTSELTSVTKTFKLIVQLNNLKVISSAAWIKVGTPGVMAPGIRNEGAPSHFNQKLKTSVNVHGDIFVV
jgi:hypothetical protein